jgi:hypothetical protein
MQASLAEAFMWAKFQVKIRKYDFAAKAGHSGELSHKQTDMQLSC